MYDGIWPAVFVDVYGMNWREFAVSVFVFCASLAKILSYVISGKLVPFYQKVIYSRLWVFLNMGHLQGKMPFLQ